MGGASDVGLEDPLTAEPALVKGVGLEDLEGLAVVLAEGGSRGWDATEQCLLRW